MSNNETSPEYGDAEESTPATEYRNWIPPTSHYDQAATRRGRLLEENERLTRRKMSAQEISDALRKKILETPGSEAINEEFDSVGWNDVEKSLREVLNENNDGESILAFARFMQATKPLRVKYDLH